MSGIIDSKSRIVDTILTQEGRRQLAEGDFVISFVSFSDAGVRYARDAVSGTQDAGTRFYLEPCSLPSDQIVIESNESGRLVSNSSMNDRVVAGQALSIDLGSRAALTGSVLIDTFDGVIDTSVKNFERLSAVGTVDGLFDTDEFLVSPSEVQFMITDSSPIKDRASQTVNVDQLESIVNDPRVSHLKNFLHLPPLNKISEPRINRAAPEDTKNYALGDYASIGTAESLKYQELAAELRIVEQLGCSALITFDPTSRTNAVVGQMFEVDHTSMRKLDVIDFGRHRVEDARGQSTGNVHVFFIGRLTEDTSGSHTFVHLFTLVFE